MNGAGEPAMEVHTLPEEPGRSRWVRVGLVSASLWAVVGLALAFLWDQTGHPRESGIVAAWTGPVAFLIVGWRSRLHGRGNWIRAAAITIGALCIAGGFAACVLAMAAYG